MFKYFGGGVIGKAGAHGIKVQNSATPVLGTDKYPNVRVWIDDFTNHALYAFSGAGKHLLTVRVQQVSPYVDRLFFALSAYKAESIAAFRAPRAERAPAGAADEDAACLLTVRMDAQRRFTASASQSPSGDFPGADPATGQAESGPTSAMVRM